MVEDRREIGTTYAFAPPRVYENLLTLTMVRMEDAGALKKKMFHYFLGVARHWGEEILNREPVPLYAQILYALGNVLVYGPLKNRYGLSRIRVAYTAGEAIGPEIFAFLSRAWHQPEAALRADREHPFTLPRSRTARFSPTPSANPTSAST